MPGLYLHIPFCRQACTYCDFHFSTVRRGHQEMVDALCRELALRDREMPAGPWRSIYFGGGTPSLLSPKQIEQLLGQALALRPLADGAELTLEANPDDLSREKLEAFAKTRLNRLSIGVQSFSESELRWMNRAHSADEALRCIADARELGFANLTIDLIYGTPELTDEEWRRNLARTIALGVPHVSAYALTVEPRTVLAHQIARGKRRPIDEERAARQMEILVDTLEGAGFEHYEVSNFARPGYRAVHNANYWRGVPYLGVGPSAHSFNGQAQRSWNVRSNARYLERLAAGELPLEREQLSEIDRYNERVMLGLRTSWGMSLEGLEDSELRDHFLSEVELLLQRGLVTVREDKYSLTRTGRMLADGVSESLFYV